MCKVRQLSMAWAGFWVNNARKKAEAKYKEYFNPPIVNTFIKLVQAIRKVGSY